MQRSEVCATLSMPSFVDHMPKRADDCIRQVFQYHCITHQVPGRRQPCSITISQYKEICWGMGFSYTCEADREWLQSCLWDGIGGITSRLATKKKNLKGSVQISWWQFVNAMNNIALAMYGDEEQPLVTLVCDLLMPYQRLLPHRQVFIPRMMQQCLKVYLRMVS